MTIPRTPSDQEGGLPYFPRMLDKARLNQKGELPEDYHRMLGNGFDGRTCKFLGVDYKDVVEKVREGLSDSEILAWCFDNGRCPDDDDILMFNSFLSKRGWRDDTAETLDRVKAAASAGDRDDIVTLFDAIDFDEGRIE